MRGIFSTKTECLDAFIKLQPELMEEAGYGRDKVKPEAVWHHIVDLDTLKQVGDDLIQPEKKEQIVITKTKWRNIDGERTDPLMPFNPYK